MYDVIVVGGGHNGLACAAYLTRAGRRVLVLEAQPQLGGLCVTDEYVPQAPGFRFNRYAIDHYMVNIAPSVVDELRLDRFGLRYLRPDPFFTYLAPDGDALPLWRDVERTQQEIRRFSPRDSTNYGRLVDVLDALVETLLPYLMGDPRTERIRTALSIARRASTRRRALATALRVVLSSPMAVLEEWFERDEVKIAVANYALFSLSPLSASGSVGLVFLPVAHRWGLRRPVGGSGAFTAALAEAVRADSGEVRTAAPVAQIRVTDGRATGVVLTTGEEVAARHVIAATDPVTLFTRLVDAQHVPAEVRGELRATQVLSHNLSTFKADIALAAPLRFPGHDADPTVLANGLLSDGLDTLHTAALEATCGRLADPPVVQYWLPSVFDRTLVPADSQGETLYLSSVVAPLTLAHGRDWSTEGPRYLEACLGVMEKYAPGLRDSVIGTSVVTPADLATQVHKANPYHVDLLLGSLGPWRPTPSLSGYRTPIDGLWHTGAGSHPTPGISGVNGRNAAAAVLRERTPAR